MKKPNQIFLGPNRVKIVSFPPNYLMPCQRHFEKIAQHSASWENLVCLNLGILTILPYRIIITLCTHCAWSFTKYIFTMAVTSYSGDLCHLATGYVEDMEGFLMVSSHHNLGAVLSEVCHCDWKMFNVYTMQLWIRMSVNLKWRFKPPRCNQLLM